MTKRTRKSINGERPFAAFDDLGELRTIGEALDFADPNDLARIWAETKASLTDQMDEDQTISRGSIDRLDQVVAGLVEETREYCRLKQEHLPLSHFVETQQNRIAPILWPLERQDLTIISSLDDANSLTAVLRAIYDLSLETWGEEWGN
jgi:hypothetical protein